MPIAQAVCTWLHLDTEVLQISLKTEVDDTGWDHRDTEPDLTAAEDDIQYGHVPCARPHVVEMLMDFFAFPNGSSRFSLQCGSYCLSMGTDILENLMACDGSRLRKCT